MNINFDKIYDLVLSTKAKERAEKYILGLSVASFAFHLLLIFLHHQQLLLTNVDSRLLDNPISAIYTPFSFILIYEVYLLIYHLPQSITSYVRKQYEIVSLIIIRRLFKDLSTIEISSNWFKIQDDLIFTIDIFASLLIFYFLYLFFRLRNRLKALKQSDSEQNSLKRFIKFKKIIALILVPLLFYMASESLVAWAIDKINPVAEADISFKNINHIFFDDFFTVLIIVDVFVLLLSFFEANSFHRVIRNSGFVLSTVLIRLSFSVEGILNTSLIVFAVAFGLAILYIYSLFERKIMA